MPALPHSRRYRTQSARQSNLTWPDVYSGASISPQTDNRARSKVVSTPTCNQYAVKALQSFRSSDSGLASASASSTRSDTNDDARQSVVSSVSSPSNVATSNYTVLTSFTATHNLSSPGQSIAPGSSHRRAPAPPDTGTFPPAQQNNSEPISNSETPITTLRHNSVEPVNQSLQGPDVGTVGDTEFASSNRSHINGGIRRSSQPVALGAPPANLQPASPSASPVIKTSHQGNSEAIDLDKLREDEIREFNDKHIKEITEIDDRSNVKKVIVYGAEKLTKIEEVGYLHNLKSLDLRDCKKLTEFPISLTRAIEWPKDSWGKLLTSLQELILQNTGIRRLPNMSNQEILQKIDISGSKIPNSEISSFKDLPALKKLDISDCEREEIPQLPDQLTDLKCCNIGLKSLKSIKNLTSLQTLDVSHNKSLEDFSPIAVKFKSEHFWDKNGVEFSLGENNPLTVTWKGTKAEKKWKKAEKKWAGLIEKYKSRAEDNRPLEAKDIQKWKQMGKEFKAVFEKTEPNWFQKRIILSKLR